jgi:diguanylate cyclase (GGDEF)-like protein
LGVVVAWAWAYLGIAAAIPCLLLGGWLAAMAFARQRTERGATGLNGRFLQSMVDALSSQMAVVDAAGEVVAVNDSWREHAAKQGSTLCPLGNNFLTHCAKVSCDDRPAKELADGIRAVLTTPSHPGMSVEHGVDTNPKRWFSLRVARFTQGNAVWALVEREEITARKQAELEVERSRAAYRELATRDELTGLFNRRALDQMLAEEESRYERYGSTVAVAMVDIDHFKRVNDDYGHAVGDAALRWLADLLAKNVRVVDKVARYGGEEFVVIAPELNALEACAMAERLRAVIVSHPFRHVGPDGNAIELPITASFGVAAIPGDVESGSALVIAADKALYAAKRCGRNCTVQFRELEEPLVS